MMTPKQIAIAATMILCSHTGTTAQMLPLIDNNLYFNADRVWSYNLYEHSRWGGGLRWTATPTWADGNRLTADAYMGYGLHDQQWKWGISFATAFAKSHNSFGAHVSLVRDLIPAGSRSQGSATLADISSFSSFMNRRMAMATQVSGGITWRKKQIKYITELHVHNGSILYNNFKLTYPYEVGEMLPRYSDVGLRCKMQHDRGLSAEIKAGYNTFPADRPYLRMLLQYNSTYTINQFTLNIFSQAGILPTGAKGSYMQAFDLGGTCGAPIFFEHSLLTVKPNEFTTNKFIYTTINLKFKKPILKYYNNIVMLGIAPRPFIQISGAIGSIDAEYYAQRDGLTDLQAPSQGIAEGAAGIEGILRWGAVDWGLAIACRLTPHSASYNYTNTTDNFRLLLTASLWM